MGKLKRVTCAGCHKPILRHDANRIGIRVADSPDSQLLVYHLAHRPAASKGENDDGSLR